MIRVFDPAIDYELLSHWWTDRELQPPPKTVLSGAFGFVVNEGGEDLAVAWVMLSTLGLVAISQFATTKPGLLPLRAAKALHALYDFLEHYAKQNGCPVLFTSSEGSLQRFLEGREWTPCAGEPHSYLLKVCT
jgi:hypothetical protein